MRKKWLILFGSVFAIFAFYFLLQQLFAGIHSWKDWNLPLTGRMIYIDPGHGGPDGGAEKGGAVEKDIALAISKKLRDYLQEQGAFVYMTRETDRDLADEDTRGLSRRKVQDLHRRADLVNESDAELFVSIHLNSIPSPKWRGAQTFYSGKLIESKIAAELIQEELVNHLKNTDREAKEINHVYLLKSVKKPAVLVEAGFLSNPDERRLLMDKDYQEKVADAIYKGILRYFTDERKERKEETDEEE
jgi:N-acetylmuramoyl-L-alanine amidase